MANASGHLVRETIRCGADSNGYAPERPLPLCADWNRAQGLESGCITCSPLEPNNCFSASCRPAKRRLGQGAEIRDRLHRLLAPGAKQMSQCIASPGKMLPHESPWRAQLHARVNGTGQLPTSQYCGKTRTCLNASRRPARRRAMRARSACPPHSPQRPGPTA
jgi:hypothetical protein